MCCTTVFDKKELISMTIFGVHYILTAGRTIIWFLGLNRI